MARAVFGIALTSAALFILMLGGVTRGMLWHTIQLCVADYRVTGSALPCLAVRPRGDAGYVVLRSPLDKSHAVLSPRNKVIGIEAPELRAPDATPYVEEAWRVRAFAYPTPRTGAVQKNMGLAINSRWRRTQDQLHIHIDCLRPSVKRRVAQEAPHLAPGRWSKIDFGHDIQPYWATSLGDTLARVNPIAIAAAGLKLPDKEADRLTIAIASTGDELDKPIFILLAQTARPEVAEDGHAEELLDHDCQYSP